METRITDLDGLTKQLEIMLTNDELAPKFEEKYKEAQKYVEIKGFRKGKVPMNMVIRMFGKMIRENSINEIANDVFKQVSEEQKLVITSEPNLEKAELTDDGARFIVHFESTPSIQIGEYRGIQIYEPVHIVSEESIDSVVEEISLTKGTFVEADEITDKYFEVKLRFDEFDKETGTILIDSDKNHEQKFLLYNRDIIPEFLESLVGLKVDDSFDFNPHNFDEKAEDSPLKVTVKEIRKIIPQELTPEFISEFSENKFDNLQDLRDSYNFRFQEQWNEKSKNEMHMQLREHLLNENTFEVPSYLVQKETYRQFEEFTRQYGGNEQQFKYEQVGHLFSGVAEGNVRWAYIVEKIAENENITVEDYDFDEYITKMGEEIANDTQLCEKIRKSEGVKQLILNQKVMDFLLDFAVTTEMPFEDYMKMQQMKQEEMMKHIKNIPHSHHHGHEHEHDHGHEEFDNVYDDELNTFDEDENSDEDFWSDDDEKEDIEKDINTEENIQKDNLEDK
ncbi:MAG TPA: trigger factor [Candidatus Kapabacteria bacterium]|nr:trigger factor [Candidatus Kapabacteria bacterium]